MMKYDVVIESTAERDLYGILTYISETLLEPAGAKRIYAAIKEQVLSLSNMPLRYALIDEEPYRSMGVRKIPVENYIAFYIVDEAHDTVHVLRILYNRRDWHNLI